MLFFSLLNLGLRPFSIGELIFQIILCDLVVQLNTFVFVEAVLLQPLFHETEPSTPRGDAVIFLCIFSSFQIQIRVMANLICVIEAPQEGLILLEATHVIWA